MTPINDLIRRGAGHAPRDSDPPDQRDRVGQIGVGRGAGSAPARVLDDVAARFNAELRLSAGVVRGRYRAADLIGN
jgi:hypothetical protein